MTRMMGQSTPSPNSQMIPNWVSNQYTGRQSCCSEGSQQAGEAGWQEPHEVQRQSPASGMDNPIQQDRLGLESSFGVKDPGVPGEQVEQETTTQPRSKDQLRPKLREQKHNQQVQGCDRKGYIRSPDTKSRKRGNSTLS